MNNTIHEAAWIRNGEHQPIKNEVVLVSTNKHDVFMAYRGDNYLEFPWVEYGGDMIFRDSEISWWMPIPELPDENGKNDLT